LWSSSKRDRPSAFFAKRPDQGHEFLGPFRVIFGISLQFFQADRRFEDKARGKSHLIRSGFRVVGSLWHLDSSLAHQTRLGVIRRGKPSVWGRQRNDEAADGDKSASKQHGMAGLLMKNDPGDNLRNKKEEDDIHADQPAEIPGRHIDRPAIAEKNHGSGEEEQDARSRCRGTQTHSDESIAAGFEQRG
jgi:hypothetical protein